MRLRILALSCLSLLLMSRPASAQTAVSAGALIGQGCQQGRDDCAGSIIGPVVSLDLGDRFVVRARGFSFKISGRTIVSQGVSINESDIKRRMLLGEFIYRFRSDKRARPLLGISMGARTDSASVNCVPGPCSTASGIGSASQFLDGSPRTHASWGLIGGFGVELTEILGLEASIGLHDLLREEGRTAEAAVYATFRLWKSK